jgi:hypothetical protein
MKAFVADLLVSVLMLSSCTTEENRSTGPASAVTPEADPSDVPSPGGMAILMVKRSLPDGPAFVEGSAAHARVVDESGAALVDNYFDLPEVPVVSPEVV